MNLIFKFHKDLIFHLGVICKIESSVFLAAIVDGIGGKWEGGRGRKIGTAPWDVYNTFP